MAGCLALAAADSTAQITQGQIPVNGPNPLGSEANTFVSLDAHITQLMEDHQISASTVGILRNGRIIYQRGFGWQDYHGGDLTPMQPGDLMRVASVTKPFTARAIVKLLGEGVIDASDRVFAYGQSVGVGILPADPYAPYTGSLGDSRLKDITVLDLLLHRGGFDRDVPFDPQFKAITIANAMGVPSPPGQINTVRYMLSQPLAFTPGASSGLCNGSFCYSNFGFVLLGLIIEEVTGMDQLDYIHDNVLSVWGGTPDELQAGRTFAQDQDPREPYYESGGAAQNVYDPTGPMVEWPYGGWDHESFAGHGDLVSNTVQVLHFLDHYLVGTDYSNPITKAIGTPLLGGSMAPPNWYHTGSIGGTYAIAWQEDNKAVVIMVNQRDPDLSSDFAWATLQKVKDWFVSPNPWPSTYATDNWADFDGGGGTGTYFSPENNVDDVLQLAQSGGTVKVLPSTTSWTGTINQPVRITAPHGAAIVGKP